MDLKEICLPIRSDVEALESFMQKQLESPVPFVQTVAHYVVANGGKRIRPILTFLFSKLAGYRGLSGISLGASIEFLHTASLLHDDVIDDAPLRRGRATTNKKWGNHVSVLVGDFFYCRAMDLLVKHGDLKVLRVVTDAVTITTEGEIFEITKSHDPSLNQEEYLRVIHGKTAALMGASCQVGAVLGSLSSDLEQACANFGVSLGMAFQLMDDVLDYSSTKEEFGKVQGTDLKEGKMTLPLIIALRQCSEAEGQLIRNSLVTGEVDTSAFSQVLQIIEKYNGFKETAALAQSYIAKARKELEAFRPSLEKDTLLALADYVVYRRN